MQPPPPLPHGAREPAASATQHQENNPIFWAARPPTQPRCRPLEDAGPPPLRVYLQETALSRCPARRSADPPHSAQTFALCRRRRRGGGSARVRAQCRRRPAGGSTEQRRGPRSPQGAPLLPLRAGGAPARCATGGGGLGKPYLARRMRRAPSPAAAPGRPCRPSARTPFVSSRTLPPAPSARRPHGPALLTPARAHPRPPSPPQPRRSAAPSSGTDLSGGRAPIGQRCAAVPAGGAV